MALTVPGLVYYAKSLPPAVRGNRTLFFQSADEHVALAYLAHVTAPRHEQSASR